MRYLIILLILLSVVSCKSQHNSLGSDQTIITPGSNLDWVFGKNFKKWDASDADIETANKLMKQGFEDQKKDKRNNLDGRSTDDYCKQYVCAESENGDKIIWINCFCKDQVNYFKAWKTNLAMVKDGGNCFINVTVNLTKNDYTSFSVNGQG